MSGPKTSHYMLTPEQRRILEEQRQIRVECELLEKQKKDARGIVERTDRILGQLEPILLELGKSSKVVEQVKALRAKTADAISQTGQATDSEGLQRLKETNKSLGEASVKLGAWEAALKRELQEADKAFQGKMKDRIAGGFDISFANIGSGSHSPFREKITEALEGISELAISEEHRNRLCAIQQKAFAIEDEVFLKNYFAMTVTPFVKECHGYHDLYTAHGEEYLRKRFLYETNANTLGIEAEEIPFSANAISLLDEKISETEAAIRFKEEQAYISRCVDEAMEELGYSVLGSREIVKRSGKRFRNALYLFDEGTAVNVTYSNDGQITMELGGIDRKNRIPTAAESESLAADMRTFCGDYGQIEKRLREKGVISKRIAILPPEPQYASIINVSDYDLITQVTEFEAHSKKKQTNDPKTRKIGE